MAGFAIAAVISVHPQPVDSCSIPHTRTEGEHEGTCCILPGKGRFFANCVVQRGCSLSLVVAVGLKAGAAIWKFPANSHEWIEFEGTLSSQPLMGGYSNVDALLLDVPGTPYRGVAQRSFDSKTQQWSIWWLDSRTPLGPLDPPMRGTFKDGVGTFYGDDTYNGRPLRARFLWTKITPTSCHWEQAYSPDEGKTWETNWVQDITRVH